MSYTSLKNGAAKHHRRTSKSRGGDSQKLSRNGNNDSITDSSGNVFLDIGFSPEEAANLMMRSELMIQIRRLIERKNLTQAKAAKLFGVTQPRISDLKRGRIELFSVDTLIGMLSRAGMQVTIHVKSAA